MNFGANRQQTYSFLHFLLLQLICIREAPMSNSRVIFVHEHVNTNALHDLELLTRECAVLPFSALSWFNKFKYDDLIITYLTY